MRGAWAGHVVGARVAGEGDVRHRSMRGGWNTIASAPGPVQLILGAH
ncbi:hypothetical protein L494_0540 [Bordetella bronchiseptica CA90 BB1334]|nr:hypothetical protein L576_0555 [Bordetella bronchiseptica OSU054]KAK65332.1 hypothetical protein L530_0561 [Bordetella bronchiseptica MO211]KCV55657.1 hypothetical protein L492_0573 [Bordetella bronchiseptica 7E71]KDB77020.1 hypothetical protein L494_0540 [Bordetella bronchiseptica CA90 BB1334]KDC66389.1 hypothetical protein L510_0562 [Bordetella bronchiseptica MBORD591]KDD44432.1 hypothetical protein L532_0592 [Bordetella bronchiseptica OSU095]